MSPQSDLNSIELPYLLVIHIPVYVDKQGHRFTDELWHKDLVRHLTYLKNFTIACPHIHQEPPPGCLSLEGYPIEYIPLPRQGGRLRNLLGVPSTVLALWKAMAKAKVVHGGIGNWNPLSLGNLTFAISAIRKRYRIIIVESSTWRVLPESGANLLERAAANLSERANRVCVSTADLSVFTQAEYKQSLLTSDAHRGHIIHASWIDEQTILNEGAALATWERKRANPPLKFLFAGRLEAGKGVEVLWRAIKQHPIENLRVDFMGKGELEASCARFAEEYRDKAPSVGMLAPVPYGEPFFAKLREYSAVLVPSLGDEQPRIVYDAYSQGVPVLASSTPGLRDCVHEGETGRLCPPNDPQELHQIMRWGANHLDELQRMGMNGLERARALTHAGMHRQRHRILVESLSKQFPAV